MKISNTQLKEVIDEMDGKGYKVGVRDISYVLLCRHFEDKVYAFRAVFGKDPTVVFQEYSIEDRIDELEMLVAHKFPEPKDDESRFKSLMESVDGKETEDSGLTFDEIKRGLEDDLQALIKVRDDVDEDGNPRLDAKDMATVVGRIADIRVKLTEKFGSKVKSEEQRVVVMQKYNDICPYCNHEIARQPIDNQ